MACRADSSTSKNCSATPASDGNNTSQLAPTLDGMGAVGGGAHAPSEHVIVEHIPGRTALLARLLLEPALRDLRLET